MTARYWLILCFFSCIVLNVAKAQSTVNLPQVVPPPADAASLGKYSDVPVSLNVGLPNINVPIYDIKTARLQVPIALNYYASGIKVEDIASWVGLGWSLDAGGTITRSVRDLDDLNLQHGFYNVAVPHGDTMSQANDWQYFDDVSRGLIDAEPDNFFYNFGGHNGKFVFGEDKRVLPINYQEPVKIEFNKDSTAFTVYTGNGDQYQFFAKENTWSYYTDQANPGVPEHSLTYISSWYLSKIVSFDRTDTITFNYYQDNELLQTSFNYSMVLGQSLNVKVNGIVSESLIRSNPLRLQNITFRNGRVDFYSSQTRTDVTGARLDSVIVSRLDGVVHQYFPIKVVRFNYSYYLSSFPGRGTGSRLRLDSVVTKGASGEDGGRFSFVYDPTMLPLLTSTGRDLFGYNNGKIDNPTLIPNSALGADTTLYNVKGGDRNTYANYLQAGVLTELHYPTGGFAKFDYEPNSFQLAQYGTSTVTRMASATGDIKEHDTTYFTPDVSAQASVSVGISHYSGYTPSVQTRPYVSMTDMTANPGGSLDQNSGDPNNDYNTQTVIGLLQGHTYRLVAGAFDNGHVFARITVSYQEPDTTIVAANGGGLRIKQVTHRDGNGKFQLAERYKYGAGESGIGYLPTSSLQLNTFSALRYFYTGVYDPNTGSCQPFVEQDKVYSATSIYDVFNLSGAPVSYGEVSRYSIDSTGNANGKTIFDFTVYHNSTIPAAQSYFEGLTVENSGWMGGSLVLQSDYASKTGGFALVRQQINRYDSISGPSGHGLKANYQENITGCYVTGPLGEQYYWVDYSIPTGTVLRTSETVYTYDQQDPSKTVAEQTSYQYGNTVHLQPTQITRSMSDGTSLVQTLRYPVDVASIAGLTGDAIAAADSLQSRHNITANLQTETVKSGKAAQTMRTDYKIWTANLILPVDMQQQTQQFPMENRIQYNAYDNRGGIVQDAKDFGEPHSYIWDYNGVYPIAAVINAAQSDIAYTSFEADGSGGWVVGNGSPNTTAGITGRKSYNLNGSITKPGLTSGNTYIVSYWTKGGALTVSGSLPGYPKTGKTAVIYGNSWTFYIHRATGVSTMTVSGNATVDELRLYPAAAEMTTCTYDPLVGMTSQADVASRITYYEFDGLTRLKRIRDQDYNILKAFDYAYQAQSFFVNAGQDSVFTRDNCAAGGTPSAVTYSVAAGLFTSTISVSDANAQARALLRQRGQHYADSLGFCTWQSDAMSGTYTRNNCGAGATPGSTSYSLSAGAANSTTSKDDANQRAHALLDAQGQANANSVCVCTWYSSEINTQYTRNNCGQGYITDGAVPVYVPAGAYTSTTSQADADQQAHNAAQAQANAAGHCILLVDLTAFNNVGASGVTAEFTDVNSGAQYDFSLDGGYMGSLPAGIYNVAISSPNPFYIGFLCGQFGYGGSFTIHNVDVTSCNQMYVDWQADGN